MRMRIRNVRTVGHRHIAVDLNTLESGSLRSPIYTLHPEHTYCLSYRFLNNVVITTVIEMVEMVYILDRRLGKRSVEQVRYVINNYCTWSL